MISGSTWNHDLHHALLGKDLKGGIAYLNGVCDSNYGYAISSGIVGTIDDLGGDTYWDISVFSHELGHNFGAEHTHERREVLVDTCGLKTCPADLSNGEATIMSYCNQCERELNNCCWCISTFISIRLSQIIGLFSLSA